MKHPYAWLPVVAFFVTSCTPATPAATPRTITVQYTFATQPWLADIYDCAGNVTVHATLQAGNFEGGDAEMAMRIGLPDNLNSSSYQIDTDDILVVINRQNPAGRLSADQVRGLFSGQIANWKDINGTDSPVQVWVFPSGEDVQQIFEQIVLSGSPVASSARLAMTSDEMSLAVADDRNAVGILTRHWKMGNVSDVFTVETVPVLVIPLTESVPELTTVIRCLQK